MRLYWANSFPLKTGKTIGFQNYTVVICIVIVICIFTLTLCDDNLGLLMGTLMTHIQISCINQPVTLHCPTTTNVIIEVAQYISFLPSKESVVCNTSKLLQSNWLNQQFTNCKWPRSLQYSLLQTAVEACRSKEECQLQVLQPKSDINPCPSVPTYIKVTYQCRPSSFQSKIGCEHDKISFKCEQNTRLVIFSASYGRTPYQSVLCPQPQGVAEEICLLSFATELVMDHCHGKQNCTLVADSKTFKNPCKAKSRVYLKVVYACVPRRVLLEKYEEESSSNEDIDWHKAPDSLDITGWRSYNNSNSSAIQHRPENIARDSIFDDEKLYLCLIGAISGVLISFVMFAIVRLIWRKRSPRSVEKYRENMSISNTSLPRSFNDVISEVDADITMAEIMPSVTVISTHHHISSLGEVVRYGEEGIAPRSFYHDDSSHFYYG